MEPRAALGATAITPRVDCEEPSAERFTTVSGKLKELDGGSSDEAAATVAAKKEESGYSKKNPFRVLLKTNLELNASDSARDTRHFEFDLTGSGLSYEVGDVLSAIQRTIP